MRILTKQTGEPSAKRSYQKMGDDERTVYGLLTAKIIVVTTKITVATARTYV